MNQSVWVVRDLDGQVSMHLSPVRLHEGEWKWRGDLTPHPIRDLYPDLKPGESRQYVLVLKPDGETLEGVRPHRTKVENSPEYPCAYCGETLEHYGDRPVGVEAVCWRCWFREYGREQSVREWKSKHWWRGLVP